MLRRSLAAVTSSDNGGRLFRCWLFIFNDIWDHPLVRFSAKREVSPGLPLSFGPDFALR